MRPVKKGDRTDVRTQDLVVLGLLMEGTRHGYDLKRSIDTALRNIADIPSATVYYTLRRLEKHGWVASRPERKGNRPERTVYRITPAGKAEFQRLVRLSLFVPERPYFAFDVGLFFAPYVGLEALGEAVDLKLRNVEQYRRALDDVEKEHPGRWPFHLYFIKERARLLLDSNETWLRRLLDKVRRKQSSRR